VLDVVAATATSDTGTKKDVGDVYVWEGGAALVGAPARRATLEIPAAVAGDELGAITGQGVRLADVTGDGRLDVVVGTRYANVGGVRDVGAIYVWEGSAALAGVPAPLATLAVAGAFAHDQLGLSGGQGLVLADVTGDGVLDVLGVAMNAGQYDTGALQLWNGGTALAGTPAPLATWTVPSAKKDDRLGL
jgi:hypothetical protein